MERQLSSKEKEWASPKIAQCQITLGANQQPIVFASDKDAGDEPTSYAERLAAVRKVHAEVLKYFADSAAENEQIEKSTKKITLSSPSGTLADDDMPDLGDDGETSAGAGDDDDSDIEPIGMDEFVVPAKGDDEAGDNDASPARKASRKETSSSSKKKKK